MCCQLQQYVIIYKLWIVRISQESQVQGHSQLLQSPAPVYDVVQENQQVQQYGTVSPVSAVNYYVPQPVVDQKQDERQTATKVSLVLDQ